MPANQNSKKSRGASIGPRAQKTRARILASMKQLLTEKGYIAITTAELAKHAQVNEGLIYHYFKNKDDVYWSVLEDYMAEYISFVDRHIRGVRGALNKIRKYVWANIHVLTREHPGGKILILEVRSNPNYYHTTAFDLTVQIRSKLLAIIRDGIADGEISPKIHPQGLAGTLIGALEHAVMPTLSLIHI